MPTLAEILAGAPSGGASLPNSPVPLPAPNASPVPPGFFAGLDTGTAAAAPQGSITRTPQLGGFLQALGALSPQQPQTPTPQLLPGKQRNLPSLGETLFGRGGTR